MTDDDRVTLREFMLVQLEAVEERFAQFIRYSEDRLSRTEKDLERRLEGMNEFRAQLEKQTRNFVTREYYETKHELIERRITELEKLRNVREGQLTMVVAMAGIGGALLVQVIHWLWK